METIKTTCDKPMLMNNSIFESQFEIPEIKEDFFLKEVRGIFVNEQGDAVRVPAYYDGEGIWKVRYLPKCAGKYTLSVTMGPVGNEKPVETKNLKQSEFIAKEKPIWDFVRIDPQRVQRFILDSGETYYPMGDNCTLREGENSFARPLTPEVFENYFTKMRETGFNFARIMVVPTGKRNIISLDNVSEFDMAGIKFWDAIFAAAEKNAIRIQVCLDHQFNFGNNLFLAKENRTRENERSESWEKSAWNIKNGGFLNDPIEILSNQQALDIFKARNRYIIARWGHSFSMMALEIINEPHWWVLHQEHPELFEKWHYEMVNYIKQVDPYDHLVTTGSGHGINYSFDYYQPHIYPRREFGVANAFTYDPANLGIYNHETGNPWDMDKPVFYGEMGINSLMFIKHGRGKWDKRVYLEKGLYERRMLWESIFSGGAGAGMFWDNDAWIGHFNLWYLFKPVTEFVKLASLPDTLYKPSESSCDIQDVNTCSLIAEDRSIGYLYHKNRIEDDFSDYSDLQGQYVLKVEEEGVYQVYWWDTQEGKIISSTSIHSVREEESTDRNVVHLTTPVFKRDLAVYVKR